MPPRTIRWLSTRQEFIADAALGKLRPCPGECGICFDTSDVRPLYDACRNGHPFCAGCLIDWVNQVSPQGESMDCCPLCRVKICQAQRMPPPVEQPVDDPDDIVDRGFLVVVAAVVLQMLREIGPAVRRFDVHNPWDVAFLAFVVGPVIALVVVIKWSRKYRI
ncbi:hypothetical protein BC567DRAFT_264258 [Phyllosticta citribraziliensis]